MGFPGGSDCKESACNAGDPGFDPWVRKILWRQEWLSTPLFLLRESHGQRSLAGGVHGVTESHMTEQLTLSLFMWNMVPCFLIH